MKKIRITVIGRGLTLAWLLACMGCGLFRNTAKHREAVRAETRESSRRVSDSITVHAVGTADFAASETSRVSETAIGFTAVGNVVIHPDGTVVADGVRGVTDRKDARTAASIAESHRQQLSMQAAEDNVETNASQTLRTKTIEKRTRPATWGYLALLAVGFTIAITWGCKWVRRT